jgi:serine/threonine protein kinase/tetratricopeptide (TPR) repeat protein
MTTTSQLESIFFAALEKPLAERATFLAEACARDTELRGRLEKMLSAHAEAGSFLEQPAFVGDAPVLHEPPIAECPGTIIGPYKLLQQIGEGGMGVVFMAEQSEPLHRTVALKIIKPGMDTRQVIARFEAERQALAMMDHPNIAKVLDAGATESGRPYFAMELVKGVPITKFCDEKHLPLRARLELFVEVCQAVQHAHQKGIIHRDIKPNNVLVAEYDDKPVPKIIDFGVAKATAQKLTEKTMFTEFGQMVGTMEYMSPEQSKLNQLDIDTRSDIYSLGVLLYELLAGSTPFEQKRLREAAFDEMLRIIREEEPQKPSTRLSQMARPSRSGSNSGPANAEGNPTGAVGLCNTATIAANRSTEPAKLTKLIRGELDWIVMKCLEKDRNRRYETASALADDLLHFMADEPVTAGPPSRLYRTGKFVRRNRVLVVAAFLVAVAILGGVAASTWQAIRATRAERAALASAAQARQAADAERQAKQREAIQRKQAEEISYFLINAFDVQNPEHDIRAVADLLKNSAQDLQDTYTDDPAAHAALLATMGRANAGLRRFGEAEQMYRKCLEVATDAGLIDRVRRELATCLLREGKTAEGVEILQGFFLDKLRRSDAPDAVELLKTWPGLPEVGATADGEPGMDALELDGDQDYVILPRIYFDARPPWTLEAIVRPVVIDQSVPVDVSPVNWTSLISATDGGAIGLETSRRRWAISLYTTRIPTGDWRESYSLAIARSEVSLREWQHVAGVWDGKELRLYLNGQLQDTRSGVDYCSVLSMAPMFLGADPDSMAYGDVAQGYLQGRLRVARISRGAEYTDSFPRPERLDKTPGTIGLYDFTIDTGRYAFDRSGHGNHGIVIGAKYVKEDHDD